MTPTERARKVRELKMRTRGIGHQADILEAEQSGLKARPGRLVVSIVLSGGLFLASGPIGASFGVAGLAAVTLQIQNEARTYARELEIERQIAALDAELEQIRLEAQRLNIHLPLPSKRQTKRRKK